MMPLTLILNGHTREFASLTPPVSLMALVAELGLRPDRVAVEYNSTIIQRDRWTDTMLDQGDKLEVVHFVGGGTLAR